MIDPQLSLAISIQSNPGLYALLLGSGVSRAAGIPTGWEIVLDLTRKLARLRGEECQPDEEVWYRETFEREPNYSELLDAVTKTSAEKMQLLRAYFEPSPLEKEQGLKVPTAAHRAIASLVEKGYVRVIISTNFDRLLEQAVTDAGIQPVVVSTSDAAHGILPLVHSRCTIVKVNGDYLDSRLRNSAIELASYEEPMNRLLDQIFDEYGLIVCGWSAEWDTALRMAIERCQTRRFTTYWASLEAVAERASNLIKLRGAVSVQVTGADQFFPDLFDRVGVLEDMAVSDPLSQRVAIGRMKKYLVSESQQINLRDLIAGETERAYRRVSSEKFSPQGGVTIESVFARMKSYEHEVNLLLSMLVCGTYWARPEQDSIFVMSFKRFADTEGPESGTVAYLELRRYPALLLLYAMGLASIARGQYRLLSSLLYGKVLTRYREEEKPAVQVLCHSDVVSWDIQKHLPGYKNRHTPLSDYLAKVLREPLREYLPDDGRYEDAFDWFEYLLCLVRADSELSAAELNRLKAENPTYKHWVPVGCFSWRNKRSERSVVAQMEIKDGEDFPAEVASLFAAGCFEFYPTKQSTKYRSVKAVVDRHVAAVRGSFW